MKNPDQSTPPPTESSYLDFTKKVKAEFPDFTSLHDSLDSENEAVGPTLERFSYFTMTATEIIEAFDAGDQNRILEAAKKANRIAKLFREYKERFKK